MKIKLLLVFLIIYSGKVAAQDSLIYAQRSTDSMVSFLSHDFNMSQENAQKVLLTVMENKKKSIALRNNKVLSIDDKMAALKQLKIQKDSVLNILLTTEQKQRILMAIERYKARFVSPHTNTAN